MTRYDPDGNEKRRARAGEPNCDDCTNCGRLYGCGGWFKVCLPATRRAGHTVDASKRDYAGECAHFVRREG